MPLHHLQEQRVEEEEPQREDEPLQQREPKDLLQQQELSRREEEQLLQRQQEALPLPKALHPYRALSIKTKKCRNSMTRRRPRLRRTQPVNRRAGAYGSLSSSCSSSLVSKLSARRVTCARCAQSITLRKWALMPSIRLPNQLAGHTMRPLSMLPRRSMTSQTIMCARQTKTRFSDASKS